MPRLCCVKGCNQRLSVPGSIVFHRFPTSSVLADEWRRLSQCRINIKYPRICSRHFSEDDLLRDLPSELLGLVPKVRVKPNAVPTLLLPSSEQPLEEPLNPLPVNNTAASAALTAATNAAEPTRTNFELSRNDTLYIVHVFDDEEDMTEKEAPRPKIVEYKATTEFLPSVILQKEKIIDSYLGKARNGTQGMKESLRSVVARPYGRKKEESISSAVEYLEEESVGSYFGKARNGTEGMKESLRSVVARPNGRKIGESAGSAVEYLEEESVERCLEAKIARLEERVNCLEQKNENLLNKNAVLREKLREAENGLSLRALESFLNESQISAVLNRKKAHVWSEEDLRRALPLMAISKECYSYLRNRLGYPLPSPDEMHRWVTKTFVCEDLIYDIVRLMEAQVEKKASPDNVCILCLEPDLVQTNIIVERPLAILKGVMKTWGQPIYTPPEEPLNQELLLNTITAVEGYGYKVVAVNDCFPKRPILWRSLINDKQNPGFPNPVDEKRKVWAVPDVEVLFDTLKDLLGDVIGIAFRGGVDADKILRAPLSILD